jgi:hypothetical protein
VFGNVAGVEEDESHGCLHVEALNERHGCLHGEALNESHTNCGIEFYSKHC